MPSALGSREGDARGAASGGRGFDGGVASPPPPPQSPPLLQAATGAATNSRQRCYKPPPELLQTSTGSATTSHRRCYKRLLPMGEQRRLQPPVLLQATTAEGGATPVCFSVKPWGIFWGWEEVCRVESGEGAAQ